MDLNWTFDVQNEPDNAKPTHCRVGARRTTISSMPVDTEIQHSAYTRIRAPRGSTLSCKGWQQEAAMRMLMNNLDEEVAERPQDLVVYGGTGKAARNWDCYHAIVRSLKDLEKDETLLVRAKTKWAVEL